MVRWISVLAISAILPAVLTAGDVPVPADPVVAEVAVPAVQPPDGTNRFPGSTLYLRRAAVKFSDGRIWKGVIQLSNDIVFSLTNRSLDHVSVDILSVHHIRKLRVVRWASEALSNGLYLFRPAEYRVFTDATTDASDPSGIPYASPLPLFDSFPFSDQERKAVLFTVFYDRWLEGKTGAFRWENTKATTFGYNFRNPVAGVVTEIEFDSRY